MYLPLCPLSCAGKVMGSVLSLLAATSPCCAICFCCAACCFAFILCFCLASKTCHGSVVWCVHACAFCCASTCYAVSFGVFPCPRIVCYKRCVAMMCEQMWPSVCIQWHMSHSFVFSLLAPVCSRSRVACARRYEEPRCSENIVYTRRFLFV